VKTFRSKGPLAERPYYSDEEIERTAVDELVSVNLLPSSPEPIRIDRFIEKRFPQASVQYEELPDGVLGYTRFGRVGVEAIFVSRGLSENGGRVAERRITSTLAHEAGHGLLHAHLFVLDSFPRSLFPDETDITPLRILCREPPPSSVPDRKYDGRWWEYQANQMMAALLLPRPLVDTCIDHLRTPHGVLGVSVLPENFRRDATLLLADTFDVNPIVADLRIRKLYPPTNNDQLTL
jgi:hypothetical protein